MIEALAIVFVVAVSAGIYLFAWMGARNLSVANAAVRRDELAQYAGTLREKILRGQREQWDSVMMGQLAARLDEVERELAPKIASR